MNVIRISDNVFEDILTQDRKEIDKEHLPYEKMFVSFPYGFLQDADELLENQVKVLKLHVNQQGLGWTKWLEDNKSRYKEIEDAVYSFADAEMHLLIDVQTNEITLTSNHQSVSSRGGVLFHASTAFGFKPLVDVNEVHSDSEWLYFTLKKIYYGVIHALQNPDVKVIESHAKERKHKVRYKGSLRNANGVRVITNVRYVGGSSNTSKKGVYQAVSWDVRGHWRHLKSGRKVWVKAYTKGNAEQQSGDNIYELNSVANK